MKYQNIISSSLSCAMAFTLSLSATGCGVKTEQQPNNINKPESKPTANTSKSLKKDHKDTIDIPSEPSLHLDAKIHVHRAKAISKELNSGIPFREEVAGKGRITLTPASGKSWDFTGYNAFEVILKNTGNKRVIPQVQLHSPDSIIQSYNPGLKQSTYLEPGERKILMVYFLVGDQWFAKKHPQYTGLRAGPLTNQKWWTRVEPSAIGKITISNLVIQADGEAKKGTDFLVEHIRGIKYHEKYRGPAIVKEPFIDTYGQFNQAPWKGKVHSDLDLKRAHEAEKKELSKKPSPEEWNAYGGWSNGPKQKATGYFYPKLIDGKWWMVDPEGCLYWSHGTTGVNTKGAITISEGRESHFEEIPKGNDPLAKFTLQQYGKKNINYTEANLYRKHGSEWEDISRQKHHRRLRSWGMNTIGNWSDDQTNAMKKTPFTVAVHYPYTAFGPKFPDVHCPKTWKGLKEVIKIKARQKFNHSSWNIGFFINNELHWETPKKFNDILFKAKPDQPSKLHFIQQLKNKYSSIQKLNQAWASSFSNWNQLLNTKKPWAYNKTQKDVDFFYDEMAEIYFKRCREILKASFPNHLYLGSRFHKDIHKVPMKKAEVYCDIISYNLYRKSIADFTGPVKNLKKPMMATEFHFGALDRGMWHCGLNYASDQDDRALHYYEFVKGALKNPLFVGTHWFQYGSQAFTGRGQDGENFQIGMVDITDTPYPELIEKVREVGYNMYKIRSEN